MNDSLERKYGTCRRYEWVAYITKWVRNEFDLRIYCWPFVLKEFQCKISSGTQRLTFTVWVNSIKVFPISCLHILVFWTVSQQIPHFISLSHKSLLGLNITSCFCNSFLFDKSVRVKCSILYLSCLMQASNGSRVKADVKNHSGL